LQEKLSVVFNNVSLTQHHTLHYCDPLHAVQRNWQNTCTEQERVWSQQELSFRLYYFQMLNSEKSKPHIY